MMKRNYWLCISILLCYRIAFTQNKVKVDSLQKVLKTNISGKPKVDVYNLLAAQYLNTDSAMVSQYTSQAIKLAEKIDYQPGIAKAYYSKGWVVMRRGYYEEARKLFKSSLMVSLKANYLKGQGNANSGIGVSYWYQGQFAKAIEMYQRALEIRKQTDDKKGIAGIFNNMGIIYVMQGNYPKALKVQQKALAIRLKIGDKVRIASSYGNLGIIYTNQRKFDEAIEMYQRAIEMQEATEDESGIANTCSNLGVIYSYKGKYPLALKMHQRALRIREKIKDRRGIGRSYQNIGNVHTHNQNYSKALEMYQQALTIKEQIGDRRGIASSCTSIGDTYLREEKYKKAWTLYQRAFKLRQAMGDTKGLGKSYLSLGKWALEQEKVSQAREYFKQALKFQEKLGGKKLSAEVWINLGIAHYIQKNYTKAQQYLEKGMQMNLIPLFTKEGAEYLAKTYQATRQPQKALESYMLFKTMTDSLLNKNNVREIAKLEERFVAKKREDSLKIRQAQQKKLHQAEVATHRANNRTAWLGTALFILLAVILGFFYMSKQRSNRQLYQANQLLQNYNEELHTANETIQVSHEQINRINVRLKEQKDHIVGSINYAQRIQKAILPLNEKMAQALPPHFIIYCPRDIVSGDFYWFEQVGDKQVIVVADCTGHGVPGAFMTMLGTQALTNIVIQNRVLAPDQILNQLDKVVRKLLQSETTLVEDGMDMVVCVIDKTQQQLQYAGAKNPLIWVQAGEMREIRGDRFGINHGRKEAPKFTLHNIDISQPTTFYMYSDGYQDQFGGPEGKKFMSPAFKQLLHQIASKPVEEQEQVLANTLNEWMTFGGKKAEQIDDIVVMGVKVG